MVTYAHFFDNTTIAVSERELIAELLAQTKISMEDVFFGSKKPTVSSMEINTSIKDKPAAENTRAAGDIQQQQAWNVHDFEAIFVNSLPYMGSCVNC